MSHEITLERFVEQFGRVNPFLENRVNGPAPAEIDVPDIHRAAFERLTSLARQALEARRGLGAVLWGEAGIGKSHLLARLARWAETAPATFLYIHNLQAAPDALPRSLLNAVVSLLTAGRRDRFMSTPLYAFVYASLLEAAGRPGHYKWTDLEAAYDRWLDGLGPAAGDRSIYEVFFAFIHAAYKREKEETGIAAAAVRWLSGGALDPDEARRLGLPPARQRDEPVALEDAQQIKQVLVALSRLALTQGRPFILALDQVDNLDEEQFAALSRFVEALLDTAPNLLVLTAGVIGTLYSWQQTHVVRPSAWDRIAQSEVRLSRLTPELAQRMVRARLWDFLSPFTVLDPVARIIEQDDLFPLGRSWSERHVLSQIEVRPRETISLAREGWLRQQARLARLGGRDWLLQWAGDDVVPDPAPTAWTQEQRRSAIDRTLEQEILGVRNRLHAEPGSLPADADRLAEVLADLLSRFCDPTHDLAEVQRVPQPRRGAPPTYHLSLSRRQMGGEKIIGVLVMATGAAVAVAGFLRRLLQESRPLDRLVLVTDERIGLPLGTKGQEYLAELQQRGKERFLVINLTFGEHAELEALSAVLARAKSEDIEIEPPAEPPQRVSIQDVIASPAWRKRALGHRLLRELVAAVDANPAEQAPSLAG
jgi:hypothetical protein